MKIIEKHQDSLLSVQISKTRKESIENCFRVAFFEIRGEKYASASLAFALAFATCASALTFLIFANNNLPSIFAFFLLCFACAFAFLLQMAAIFASKKREEVEADLPMAIRHAAIAISIKVPYEKVIAELSEAQYNSSVYFKDASLRVKSGESVQSALFAQALALGSRHFSRFVSALATTYEQGGDSSLLYALADDLSASQMAKIKEFCAKAVFTGLLFVSAACILPSFFMIYSTISASIGFEAGMPGGTFSKVQTLAVFLLVFPLIDLIFLGAIMFQTPPALQFRKKYEVDKKARDDYIVLLEGAKISRKNLTYVCGAGALMFALFGLVAWPSYVVAVFLAIAPSALAMLEDLEGEKRVQKIEEELADALGMAASAHKGAGLEKIADTISKHGRGPLAEEFEIVKRQIAAGVSPKSALENMAQRNDSLLLRRAVSLLALGYRSGADMRAALRKVSEDLYSVFGLVRERNASMIIQKYTILAGCAILAPLIIGVVLGMSGTIMGLQEQNKQIQKENYGISSIASACYIVIFALIASVYIAVAEGDAKKAVVYAMFCVPLSIFVLALSSGVKLI